MADAWDMVALSGARDTLIRAARASRDHQLFVEALPPNVPTVIMEWGEERQGALDDELDDAAIAYLAAKGQLDAADEST